MGILLSELGKKLAERWMSLLVLPGALYLAVMAGARSLGHAHPFSVSRLTGQITVWADSPVTSTVGGQMVLLAAALAGAAAVGLSAQALGSLAERLSLAADWKTWPPPLRQLARHRATRRRLRWDVLARRYHDLRDRDLQQLDTLGQRADPTERRDAQDKMIRVAYERPGRPTWSGDRINAVAIRLERERGLDLAVIWPQLWLILPDTTRAEITIVRQALTRSTTLMAWAVMYLLLVVWWWPATLIGIVLAFTGRARTRSAADAYALLLEAAVRLYARDLADHLGFAPTGPLTAEGGADLTDHLAPGPPPPPPAV